MAKKVKRVVISEALYSALMAYADSLDDLLDYGIDAKWYGAAKQARDQIAKCDMGVSTAPLFEDAFREETERLAAKKRSPKPKAAKPSGKASPR